MDPGAGAAAPARQQSILFLNRRGSATMMICRQCGYVFHVDTARSHGLSCHGPRPGMPPLRVRPGLTRTTCPPANAIGCAPRLGTQQVENWSTRPSLGAVHAHESDTTRRRGAHDEFLRPSARHRRRLIGTQMIAKGLDMPSVTLVVISADCSLSLPDSARRSAPSRC